MPKREQPFSNSPSNYGGKTGGAPGKYRERPPQGRLCEGQTEAELRRLQNQQSISRSPRNTPGTNNRRR